MLKFIFPTFERKKNYETMYAQNAKSNNGWLSIFFVVVSSQIGHDEYQETVEISFPNQSIKLPRTHLCREEQSTSRNYIYLHII